MKGVKGVTLFLQRDREARAQEREGEVRGERKERGWST
jgi:hypothetical protein